MRKLALCSLLLGPCAAWAQALPDSPENLVVTATRVPSTVANLPAGVTVIDRQTIEARGYVSLVDALSAVPGLRVVQSGGPGSQTSVFIRGTNSNQVLVLRDGVPVNDPGDPSGAYNFGVDTLADVERIEVVRGAMSSLYGSGAIGGVINVITRHGRGPAHGSVLLGGGSQATGIAQGDVRGGFGIYDYAAAIEGFSTRGFDQTPPRERGVYTGEVDGDRSKLAQIEVGATPFTDTRFSVLLRGRDATYGYDEPDFDASNATGYDASLFGRLGVTSKMLAGAWETSVYVTGVQEDRRYTVRLLPGDPNAADSDDRYSGRRVDAQWNNTIRLRDAAMFTANSVTFGYEHQSDRARTKADDLAFGAVSEVGAVRAHADTDGGYAGGQTTLWRRLTLTGQLREDATTIAGDATTWRVGGVLDLSEIATHVKAAYGTSFRAPSLNDRYGFDSFGAFGFFVGNPHLQPERGRGYEAGFTTAVSRSVSVGATYFRNDLRQLIEFGFLADGNSTEVNVERARTQGVETVATARFARWLQADLTYTYTDARNLGSGARLLRRPYNQGSANLRILPIPSVTIAPELVYTGSFQDFLTADDGTQGFVPGLSRSGTIVNLSVTWRIGPEIELFAWGKNVGNSRFEAANGYVVAGASVLAGGRYRF